MVKYSIMNVNGDERVSKLDDSGVLSIIAASYAGDVGEVVNELNRLAAIIDEMEKIKAAEEAAWERLGC